MPVILQDIKVTKKPHPLSLKSIGLFLKQKGISLVVGASVGLGLVRGGYYAFYGWDPLNYPNQAVRVKAVLDKECKDGSKPLTYTTEAWVPHRFTVQCGTYDAHNKVWLSGDSYTEDIYLDKPQ